MMVNNLEFEKIHGWDLLTPLEPIHRNVAKKWFSRRPDGLAGSFRLVIHGTIIGDESRGEGRVVQYQTLFSVKSSDKLFLGVAPTARAARVRANKLLKTGICKAAGYPVSTL